MRLYGHQAFIRMMKLSLIALGPWHAGPCVVTDRLLKFYPARARMTAMRPFAGA